MTLSHLYCKPLKNSK